MSTHPTSHTLFVGIDVGSQSHAVAFGDENGNILHEFEMPHTHESFEHFFQVLEQYAHIHQATPRIAMEGYNGWARPLDQLILHRGYALYNVNNVKLSRFKEMFPGAAKTDTIDARKILELFALDRHLPAAKNVLQPVCSPEQTNATLKRLTRRYAQLTQERIVITNRLGADLQAVAPELKALSKRMHNRWFLRLLTLRKDIRMLPRLHASTLQKIPYMRQRNREQLRYWQQHARFGDEIEYVAPMIYEDALRALELMDKLKALKQQIQDLVQHSSMATLIQTIPGFGPIVSATLAGEIGSIHRFKSEASLALYLGTTTLDNSSGKRKSTKRNQATNRHAKNAITTATALNGMFVEESYDYLQKKKSEGKKPQQAIRSLSRHLTRIIWKMIQQNRPYERR
jgi:transposase